MHATQVHPVTAENQFHCTSRSTTLAKKIGTATRKRAQVRDCSSMHAPVVCTGKRACLNFFGQGSTKRCFETVLFIRIRAETIRDFALAT